jgi:uncharacterized membrane protein YdfJ with MMPL/SSD domain
MFEIISKQSMKWPWTVLAVMMAVIAAAGVYGAGVFGVLTQEEGFVNPDAQSYNVEKTIEKEFAQTPDAIVVFESKDKSIKVDDERYRQQVVNLLKPLADAGAKTDTYYSLRLDDMVSRDRLKTFATVRLEGSDEEKFDALMAAQDKAGNGLLSMNVGGKLAANKQANEQVRQDLERAEIITLPILAVLLFFVFRSVVAALLPLLLGVISIVGAFAVTRLLTNVAVIDQYALNVITILGLGLSVDYSLLMVSRFREELAKRGTTASAVRRTVMTAGRTILFSGLTVMASLSALTVFPIGFLRSVGLGGVSALVVSLLAALTILPPLLMLLGKRIDWGRFGRSKPAVSSGKSWRRFGRFVMKQPFATIGLTLWVIIVAALPLLTAHPIGQDYRSLPSGSSSRIASEILRNDFDNQNPPISVIYRPAAEKGTDEYIGQIYDLSKRISVLDGVSALETPTPIVDTASRDGYQQLYANNLLTPELQMLKQRLMTDEFVMLQVRFEGDASDEAPQSLVKEIRGLENAQGSFAVGGDAAMLKDTIDTIMQRLPYALLIIAVSQFVLLALLLRSLLIPLQAIIINVLALLVSFSLLVLIFQHGYLTGGPVGFIDIGGVDITMPILIFAIAFGLSMDYASFLYARMREEYDKGASNNEAVVRGLQKTGPIITAAALVLFVVVVAFASSKLVVLQQVGVGLASAVLIDAFVVRLFLVPATLKLFGRANWYAPRWMSRFAIRHD